MSETMSETMSDDPGHPRRRSGVEIRAAVAFGRMALTNYIAQLAWSPWWLARLRFGPLEWLWRTVSYRRRQPMRIGG